MALVWLDSFDHYTTVDVLRKYLSQSGTATIVAAGGRHGSAGFSTTYTVNSPIVPTSGNIAIVGFAFKINNSIYNGHTHMFYVKQGGNVHVTLYMGGGTGLLAVCRGASGGTNVLGTALNPLTAGAYYYIEMKVVIHPTAGSVIVRVNEQEVINVINQNTTAIGTQVWDGFAFGAYNTAYGGTFDDLYVLDGSSSGPNDFLGDCRVDCVKPTNEGAASDWAPSSGSDNALMVDDPTPDDDTTYVSTTTIGQVDTHITQDSVVAGAPILGVQVNVLVKKSDVGSCTIASVIRQGGQVYVGPTYIPSTLYEYSITPYSQMPSTPSPIPWTEATFNGAEFGYKRVS